MDDFTVVFLAGVANANVSETRSDQTSTIGAIVPVSAAFTLRPRLGVVIVRVFTVAFLANPFAIFGSLIVIRVMVKTRLFGQTTTV